MGQKYAGREEGTREGQDPESLLPQALGVHEAIKDGNSFLPILCWESQDPSSLYDFIITLLGPTFFWGTRQTAEGIRVWRDGGGRGQGEAWPISRCVGVCMCEGLEEPESWWGENRAVPHGWHRVCDCAMLQGTAQGLDGTPARSESQLDSATEEQHRGPCPTSGVVKAWGGSGGGRLWRGK